MKVGLIDDEIIVMEPGDRYKALAQYMCWDKRTKSLRARATLERLNGLAGIFPCQGHYQPSESAYSENRP